MTTNPMTLALYDTTLRDGSQRKGISLSVGDKAKIAMLLEDFGIPYLECGWPGSNPKDAEFFAKAKQLPFKSSKLVAFGATRRKGIAAEDDGNLQALLAAETPAVAIVGKTWTLHVEKVLGASLAENLAMINESVSLMRQRGREVVYDAEHFFDGYRANREYAVDSLVAAAQAGAEWLVLCDTNGGSVPSFIQAVVGEIRETLVSQGISTKLGIHAHNDSELAVANSLVAVDAGCVMIQGTINGYGERCGNANLVSIAPTLEIKMNRRCVPVGALSHLTELSRKVAEIVNLSPDTQAPYVGSSAFAHKGGIHVAAVEKIAASYEHIDPEIVGNRREIVVSELSGRGNIRVRATEMDVRLEGVEAAVLEQIKHLESKGFQFENAEGSFELIMRRAASGYLPPFSLVDVMVVSDSRSLNQSYVQAMVKVRVGERLLHTVSDGYGPVHALDGALRKALGGAFPELADIRLTDYKVRILDPESATAAITRVLIEASYNQERWTTVGCSENIIHASCTALCDSFEYAITRYARHNVVTAKTKQYA
jgi:2-isopropylmalate synthase